MDEDNYVDIEIAIVLDCEGEYRIASDIESARDSYNEDVTAGKATENIILTFRKRAPKAITVEASATLPQSEDGTYRLELQQS